MDPCFAKFTFHLLYIHQLMLRSLGNLSFELFINVLIEDGEVFLYVREKLFKIEKISFKSIRDAIAATENLIKKNHEKCRTFNECC